MLLQCVIVYLIHYQVLPKSGHIFAEDLPSSVLCKPKILPLKSVTLEKLEKMQREAQDAVMEQDKMERQLLQQQEQASFRYTNGGGL